jgi:hypothetical protein
LQKPLFFLKTLTVLPQATRAVFFEALKSDARNKTIFLPQASLPINKE